MEEEGKDVDRKKDFSEVSLNNVESMKERGQRYMVKDKVRLKGKKCTLNMERSRTQTETAHKHTETDTNIHHFT